MKDRNGTQKRNGAASIWLTVAAYRDLWESWELRGQNPEWLKSLKWDLWDGRNKARKDVTLTGVELRQVTQWDFYTPWGWCPDPESEDVILDDPFDTFQLDFYGPVAEELAQHFED